MSTPSAGGRLKAVTNFLWLVAFCAITFVVTKIIDERGGFDFPFGGEQMTQEKTAAPEQETRLRGTESATELPLLTPEEQGVNRERLNNLARVRHERRQEASRTEDPYVGQTGVTGQTVLTPGCGSESRTCIDFPDGQYPQDSIQRVGRFILREIAHSGTLQAPPELIRWQFTDQVPRTGCSALANDTQVCWADNPNYAGSRN